MIVGSDIVGLVAVTLLFGGGTLFLLAVSPVGKAVAARILGRRSLPLDEDEVKQALDAMRAELDELRLLRGEVAELAERVDFAERLLAHRPGAQLGSGAEPGGDA